MAYTLCLHASSFSLELQRHVMEGLALDLDSRCHCEVYSAGPPEEPDEDEFFRDEDVEVFGPRLVYVGLPTREPELGRAAIATLLSLAKRLGLTLLDDQTGELVRTTRDPSPYFAAPSSCPPRSFVIKSAEEITRELEGGG